MIVVSLLLGAVSALSAAWMCAAWLEVESVSGTLTTVRRGEESWEMTYIQSRPGHTRINFVRGRVRFDRQESRFVPPPYPGQDRIRPRNLPPGEQCQQEARVGWPWRALRCKREAARIDLPRSGGYRCFPAARVPATTGGIELPVADPYGWRPLPFQPIWWGLFGNVLLHALAWWMLLASPAVFRRLRRKEGGQCPQCAYDLRGSTSVGCPECGWGREAA
jgi:hypothetical protein